MRTILTLPLRATLLFLVTLCIAFFAMTGIVFGQPLNDSCHKAFVLTPSATLNWITTDISNCKIESFNLVSSCNRNMLGDVWLTFVSTTENTRIAFRAPANNAFVTYSMYIGNCNSLVEFYCRNNISISRNQQFEDSVFRYPIGTRYYIRLFGAPQNYIPTWQLDVAVQSLNNPRRIVSTIAGGDWNQPLTWIGGRVPTYGDTAVIQDGARVNYALTGDGFRVGGLEVGQGDTTKNAVLRIGVVTSTNPVPNLELSYLRIGKRDTVAFVSGNTQPTFREVRLLIGRFIDCNGFMSFASNSQPRLYFDSSTVKQSIYGTGLIKGPLNLFVNNPAGVDIDMPLTLSERLDLSRGLLTATKPITFVLSATLFGAVVQLNVFRGDFKGVMRFSDSISAINIWTSHPLDSSRNIFKYIESRRRYSFAFNGSLNGFAYGEGNIKSNAIRFTGNPLGILKLRPSDTVFNLENLIMTNGLNPSFNNPILYPIGGGIMNATICQNLRQIGRLNGTPLHVWTIDSLRRISAIRFYGLVNTTIPNYNLYFKSFRASGPALGQCLGTIGRTIGQRVMRISTSGLPLPQGVRMGLYIYPKQDSITAPRQNWRVVQGASPTGPWRDITDLAAPIEIPNINGTPIPDVFVLRIRSNVDFSLGEYFTFGVQEVPLDLSVQAANAIAIANSGLCGPRRLSLNLQLRNDGAFSSNKVVLGYRVLGPNNYRFTGRDTLDLRPNMPLNALDTLTLKPINSPILNGVGRYDFTVWLDSTSENRLVNLLDTIRFNFTNTPRWTAPVLIARFDSVSFNRIPYQWSLNNLASFKTSAQVYSLYRITLPVRNFRPVVFATAASRSVSGIENSLYTAPIALASGNWEIGFKYYPFNYFARSSDSCYVEYSTDCGNTYVPMTKFGGNSYTYYTSVVQWLTYPFSVSKTISTSSSGYVHFRIRTVMPQPSNAAFPPEYGIYMDSIQVIRPLPTSASQDLVAIHPLTLAPNPATSEVAIMGLSEELTPYTLINNLGQVVLRGKASASDNKIPLQGLPRGLYTVATERERLRLVVE